VVDPRETREGLSAREPVGSRYLGHRTNLAGKSKGENSISEKPWYDETIRLCARQDPDGKVKAGLLEPECPIWKLIRVGNDGRNPTGPLKSLRPTCSGKRTDDLRGGYAGRSTPGLTLEDRL